MSQISDIRNPWRNLLFQQASFRGVMFHVDVGARASGRRMVAHEYPKRNDPYSEDMGRQARRFNFSGYLVYRPRKSDETNPILYDYVSQRTKLYTALEADDVGVLIHPVFCPGSGMSVICDHYSMSESRERGGYTEFNMSFVEFGQAVSIVKASVNTSSQVNSNATAAEQSGLSLPIPTK